MNNRTTYPDEEFLVQIGRADKGQTFVHVIHSLTQKVRIQVGLEGELVNDVVKRLITELRKELGA